ncbi:cellulose binding domain-containing protein [Actinoplanes flavus]|uniref:Cellulose binding domain-containing protein n=1 Tax=Actinoplanes flavus TaxID=2820290 RepID=A0ABS3UR62_9ACTN|nr:cellulose binding domain-containing protein [Actinoplanes flavus]MBO3741264.1 cellulose binding domain-containing protein [Actinoplanes flavus]
MRKTAFREGGFREGLAESLPWLPIVIAVGLLLFMVVLTGFRLLSPDREDVTVGAAPGRTLPAPLRPAAVTSSAPTPAPSAPGARSPVVRPSYTRLPVRTPSTRPSTRPPAVARPSSPAPTVTGAYRVMAPYDREFIGEVLVTNAGAAPADWVVELVFPDEVGELRTSWVESAPQPTLSRSGDRYIWRSGAPVAAGSSAPLRFQYAHTGTDGRPSSCTVNGSPCSYS